ncbi:hypothetical protein EB118_08830, partial [bacterium]|nr:hypothetical protein [bacterium]
AEGTVLVVFAVVSEVLVFLSFIFNMYNPVIAGPMAKKVIKTISFLRDEFFLLVFMFLLYSATLYISIMGLKSTDI